MRHVAVNWKNHFPTAFDTNSHVRSQFGKLASFQLLYTSLRLLNLLIYENSLILPCGNGDCDGITDHFRVAVNLIMKARLSAKFLL